MSQGKPDNPSPPGAVPEPAAPRIAVHQMNKCFIQDARRIQAVQDLSFQVGTGEVFGLLGPNGAGKTTTIRMILGLVQPDSGYATIDGVRSDQQPDLIKQWIGFVSANTGLYQWLTTREILQFFASIYGVPADIADQRVEEVSEQLAMQSFLDQRCGLLSTGQAQRVNLAKALVHSPPIMLLDEPTLGLDVVGSQVVFDYLELLKTQGSAVILSTHRLEQAQRVCDRLGLMNQGRLRLEGTWDQLAVETGKDSLVDIFVQWKRESEVSTPVAEGAVEPAATSTEAVT